METKIIQETSQVEILKSEANADEERTDENMDSAMDCSTEEGSRKRKAKKGGVGGKRRKVNAQLPKNPLMQLNELKPGLEYIFEPQQGPPHDPIFVASVQVNDQKFIGKGTSKRLAKHAAAHAALSSFLQFEDMSQAVQILKPNIPNVDFTADTVESESPNHKNGVASLSPIQTKLAKKISKVMNDPNKANPIMALNELHPGIDYKLIGENVNNPSQRFQISLILEGEEFQASGPSKKVAKASAAKLALSKLYNVRFSGNYALSSSPVSITDKELFDFPQTIADEITKRVNNAFLEVMVGYEEYVKWKVLAGIVMTRDEEMKDMEVIAISTGTKHLNGEYMSMTGTVVSDCHAEIISRRCLKDYFYTQLELHVEGEGDQSIFQKKADGKFCLKPGIKFHLFISTSPCGDARIFSVHQKEDSEVLDPHPNRKARGLLRSKMESGEGTIPLRPGQNVQAWDGIIQGLQRYLAMSCSDKLASWNVLGLQGCLLNKFIDPIYLESIVLGGLFHNDHMYRAMCGRFAATLENVPEPFKLHKPKMCATTPLETRLLTKSPNYSVNWTVGLGRPEIVIAKTGKVDSGVVSRLAKRSFLQRYSNLFQVFSGGAKNSPHLYSSVKESNVAYTAAKKAFVQAFALSGLGMWLTKPIEENDFQVL